MSVFRKQRMAKLFLRKEYDIEEKIINKKLQRNRNQTRNIGKIVLGQESITLGSGKTGAPCTKKGAG